MPEYLAPGVYVEEVSFRSKSIQGVPTSTTGFAGLAHYGPVQYPDGPRASEPRLVTSYAEFERVYGGLETFDDGLAGTLQAPQQPLPYLAHAARAFFLNGGSLLYVSRIYQPSPAGSGVAWAEIAIPTPAPSVAHFRARWPGDYGNALVTVSAVRGGDVGIHTPGGSAQVSGGIGDGTILEIVPPGAQPAADTPLTIANLRVFKRDPDGSQIFTDSGGNPAPPSVTDWLLPVQVDVTVSGRPQRQDLYARLGLAAYGNRAINMVLALDNPEDEDGIVWFDYASPPDPAHTSPYPIHLLMGLAGDQAPIRQYRLHDGKDGTFPQAADAFAGLEAAPDDITKKATGLAALAEVDDVAIVALPDAGAIADADLRFEVAQRLVRHAEECRYRIAIVDGPQHASINTIRAFRGNFDSSYAALYHPWIEVLDPNGPAAPGIPTQKLELPPSGFVAGIYARSDITRGVYKAPANEIVYGLTRFESNINQGRDKVLNPENINALRFFPDRGNRVWGARTLSSDPEWLYVNVRRLFIYLEHSIDKSTQWVVFEPNNEELWRNITQTIKDFLEVQWRNGALLGATPDQAYFVHCDRSTMSQNDLDNGRLICLIGVAPVKPAEFVIFRIGQWTGDARG
ncbi:MAG TPA: phage tail sheath subtilisin-like domain-containing protein [Streptosporangiaceae bacterium]|nr:phage tail sheath subtilisin-like domain-containing protein [Streptosporangiaceae bacterium]